MLQVKRILLAAIVSAATAPALMAQTAPSANGQMLFKQNCGACHSLDNATTKHLPQSEWRAIVTRMIANGADIAPADQDAIVAYLSKSYGPASAH
jgi:cytochrome c2